MQEGTQSPLNPQTHDQVFSYIISYVDQKTMMECRLVNKSIKKIVDSFFENGEVSLFKRQIYANEKFICKMSLSLYEIIAYIFQEQVLKEKKIRYEEREPYTSFMQFLNEEATDRMLLGEKWLSNPQQFKRNYANTNAHFSKFSPIKEALKTSHEWDLSQQVSAQDILNEIVVLELERGENLHAFKIAKIMIRSQYSIKMETLWKFYEKLNLFSPKFFAYAEACWKQKKAVQAIFQDASFNFDECNGLILKIAKLLGCSCEKYHVMLDKKTQENFVRSSFKHPRQLKFASWITPLVQMKEGGQAIQSVLIEVIGGLAKQKEYKVIFSILLAILQADELCNLIAFEKHLQELDDGGLIKTLKSTLDWLCSQANKRLAIKYLKNFLEFLPRKMDQTNLQQRFGSPSFFSLLTGITMIFDRVQIHHFPHLESFYVIGHLAKAIQEQRAILSEELQKKIIDNLNSPHLGLHSMQRPKLEWMGQALHEWKEGAKDAAKLLSSFFTELIEQNIYWPVLDICSALYQANHPCPPLELQHFVSMMVKSILNLPPEQIFDNQAARRLLQNFKTFPASVYGLALEVLSSIIKEGIADEEARNIEDPDHRASYQLLRLLNAYNLPIHDQLQKEWLLKEISKETNNWLTHCKIVLLPKAICIYNGLESNEVDVNYAELFDKMLCDLMKECIDESMNRKEPELRLVCMIRLFCIADRMGLVSPKTWDLAKKEIQQFCESKQEMKYLFFIFSVSRPRDLLEDLKTLLIDLPELQRSYIEGLVQLLAAYGEEEEKQWVSEMIKMVKRELGSSENFTNEFLHSTGPFHELSRWLSNLEKYLPKQNDIPTMREITNRFKEMGRRKRELNLDDFVMVNPGENEFDWELAAAMKASVQDGQEKEAGEGKEKSVEDELIDAELYDPDLVKALELSLQEH